MSSLSTLSLGDLAVIATQRRMVDELAFADGQVMISLGRLRLTLAEADAVPFLRGVVRTQMDTNSEPVGVK